jgi:hypothetical protein
MSLRVVHADDANDRGQTMKRALLSLVAAALLVPAQAHAEEEWTKRDRDRHGWYLPDFARVGTGGYQGLANVNVGYAMFNDIVNWSIGYGFTPAFTAGRNVHSLDMTLSIRPLDFRYRDIRIVPAYFGAGLLFGTGNGYFLVTPSRYSDYSRRYYPPTAVHWTAHVGLEVDWLPKSGFFERHGVFVEVRTLDSYFVSWIENQHTLALHEALATGFGYRAAF